MKYIFRSFSDVQRISTTQEMITSE